MSGMEEWGLKHLCCYDVAYDNKCLWFFNVTYPAIFKIDLDTQKINLIHLFECHYWDIFYHYSQCVVFENDIFFIPYNSKSGICVYNKEKNTVNFLPFATDYLKDSFFYMTKRNGHYLYIAGRSSCAKSVVIIRFDMKLKEINVLSRLNEQLCNKYSGLKYSFWTEIYLYENNLYIPCVGTASILRCDIDKEYVSDIKIDEKLKGIYTICKNNENFYISTLDGDIYYSDSINSDKWSYIGYVAGGVCRSICVENTIYFLPMKADQIYYLTSGDMVLKKVSDCIVREDDIPDQILKNCYYYAGYSKTFAIEKDEDNCIYVVLADGYLYRIQNGNVMKKMELAYGTEREIFQMMFSESKTETVSKEYGRAYLPVGLNVLKSYNIELLLRGLQWITRSNSLVNREYGHKIYENIKNVLDDRV